MKVKTLAEDENRKILVTESKFVNIVYGKKEKKALVVIENNVIHVLDNVETDEEIEERFNEDLFDITIKAGAALAKNIINQNTK